MLRLLAVALNFSHVSAAGGGTGPVEIPCADDLDFQDIFGFPCGNWDGFNCRTYYNEAEPYTKADLLAVRVHCPKSCKLCTVCTGINPGNYCVLAPVLATVLVIATITRRFASARKHQCCDGSG
jgi:hypothetical protein